MHAQSDVACKLAYASNWNSALACVLSTHLLDTIRPNTDLMEQYTATPYSACMGYTVLLLISYLNFPLLLLNLELI